MNIKEKRMDRYEEAMSRMLQWEKEHPDGYNIDAMKIFVFPELEESEDERIRKEIVDYFSQFKDDGLRGVDITPWIAYLEKQKEQKPLSTEETELNSIAFLEQLGYTCVPPIAEQKPAEWSEEDKRAIDRACVALRAYSNGDLPEFLPSELLGYADRLQSLSPRSRWKPSEEQMEALKLIVSNKKHYAPVLHEIALDTLYNDLLKLL